MEAPTYKDIFTPSADMIFINGLASRLASLQFTCFHHLQRQSDPGLDCSLLAGFAPCSHPSYTKYSTPILQICFKLLKKSNGKYSKLNFHLRKEFPLFAVSPFHPSVLEPDFHLSVSNIIIMLVCKLKLFDQISYWHCYHHHMWSNMGGRYNTAGTANWSTSRRSASNSSLLPHTRFIARPNIIIIVVTSSCI